MRYSRNLRLWLVACAACLPMHAAPDLHPAGILLAVTGVAEFQWAGTSTWHPARAGMVVSPGDSLRTAAGTVRFAFCPDKSAQTLLPGKTLLLPASNLAATAGLTDRASIPSCDLPPVPETDGTMAVGGARGSAGPASADCTGGKVDLLEALSEAARAGETAAALETYRKIACYEGAAWTRGVVARIADLQQNGGVPQEGGETYALLIGISDYPSETPQGKLLYADADAEAFATFLKQKRGGALPDDHIKLLTNNNASLAAIEQAASTFVRKARNPKNTLIILLAGHGDYLPTKMDPVTNKVVEQAPFFLTYDSYAQDGKTTGLRMSRFQEIISEEALSFSRVIAFVDVCHAGHVEEAGDRSLPDAVQKVFVDNQGLLGLMMATSSRGVAFESPTFGGGHGAFTYSVLEGLNGKVNPNENRQITLDDLYNQVFNRVRFLTNNAQTPRELDVRFNPIVLENVTGGPAIDLGAAEPMTKEQTGRRERGKAETAGVSAPEAGTQPAPAESTFDRLLRQDPLAAIAEVETDAANPALSEADRFDRSERLRIALEDRGQQILIRYLRGEQNAMVKADFSLCANYFRAALDRAPFDAFDESRMLFCEGRAAIFDRTPQAYAAGMDLLERAILLDPERSYAYNAMGIAWLEQARGNAADYGRAIAAFQDAIRFAPQWAYPLHNLALVYAEQGNFEAASRAYQQAMRLAPNYSYLPYNLGLLNQNVNRLDEAEKYYRQAIDAAQKARDLGIEPGTATWRERAVVWNALATVEMARNRYKQASADLQLARNDDPGLGSMKHNQALLLSRKGPSPEAERLWREAIQADPPAFASRIALAEYLLRNHRDPAARTEFENLVVSLDISGGQLPVLDVLRNRLPFDAELFELYGDEAARLGRMADAVGGYEAAMRAYRSRGDRERVQKKQEATRKSAPATSH